MKDLPKNMFGVSSHIKRITEVDPLALAHLVIDNSDFDRPRLLRA